MPLFAGFGCYNSCPALHAGPEKPGSERFPSRLHSPAIVLNVVERLRGEVEKEEEAQHRPGADLLEVTPAGENRHLTDSSFPLTGT